MDELMAEAKKVTIGMGVGLEMDEKDPLKKSPAKKDGKLHILENSDSETD